MSGFTGRPAVGTVVEFATRAYDADCRVWVQEDSHARSAVTEGTAPLSVDAWGHTGARFVVLCIGGVEHNKRCLSLLGAPAIRES